MNFIYPSKYNITIYTKSGCPNCLKAKKLIETYSHTIIDCDDDLIDYRDDFLQIIRQLTYKEENTPIYFPIIFDNEKYIGGFEDLKLHLLIKKDRSLSSVDFLFDSLSSF